MTDEQAWIEAFRNAGEGGRRARWECAYLAHREAVFALGRSVLGDPSGAEDVLQETYLAAWRYGDRFRGAGSLRGWILRIAANLSRRALLRERARRELIRPLLRPEQEREGAPEPATELLAKERAVAVRSALARLPAEHRMAVSVSALGGLSTEEMAAILGCPPGTVWSRVHHAKKKLAHALRGLQPGEGT
ncbi:MAG TPA: RNA polymerase sigma factor [Planctomycetota bacterium]